MNSTNDLNRKIDKIKKQEQKATRFIVITSIIIGLLAALLIMSIADLLF